MELLFSLVTSAMLHTNRVGQVNRCLNDARNTLRLLAKLSGPTNAEDVDKVRVGIQQACVALATSLSTRRHFMQAGETNGLEYDPRYLVFEFCWNIVLRQKQIGMVSDANTACVQQIH